MSLDEYAIRVGSTGRFLLVEARDEGDPFAPKAGLRFEAPGATAAYVRDTDAIAVAVPLADGADLLHRPGAWLELEPNLAPGVYRFGVPDEMLAPGAMRAVVVVRFPGARIAPVDVDLVAYDPQDAVRLGLGAISPEARLEALRGAFPNVAAREMEEERAKAGD